MANRNRNRSKYASDENWDKNSRQENYGNMNYGREDDRSSDWRNQSRRDGNYGSDRGSNSRVGYVRDLGDDYREGIDRPHYGSYGNFTGTNYGETNFGRRDDDWNRQSRQNINQQSGQYSRDEDYDTDEDLRTRRKYSSGGYDQREDDYRSNTSNQPRNMYGGDTSNYGNANQGGYDRGWWDRTRDEVSSWFGDDDAERRRQMDKVNGPHRGKGPKGYKRSDERIKEDVCDRLCDNPAIDASDIEIKVDGSEVILTGTVESREAKRRAEDVVESVSGVSNVQNQLRVNRSEGGSTARSMNEGRS